MRVRGENCVIDAGKGGKSPPEPFVELDDEEALALISSGAAKAVVVGEEVVSAEVVTPQPAQEPIILDAPVEGDNPAQVVVQEPAQEPPAATVEGEEVGEREAALLDHFELLAEADYVATGERAGKPKVSVLKASTGLEDLTTEEIDAAFAKWKTGQE